MHLSLFPKTQRGALAALLFGATVSLNAADNASAPDPALNRSPKYEVRAQGLAVKLSANGEIVCAVIDGREKKLSGETSLGGCIQIDAAKVEKLSGGAVEFTRTLQDSAAGRTLTVVDRFKPGKDNSVRWDIEVVSEGEPWTTEIITELNYPATAATRFWTAWSDPEHKGSEWRDPLVLRPFTNAMWTFGGLAKGDGYIALPLATVAEPAEDYGLSMVFSPEDTILVGSRLTTTSSGAIRFSRVNYRLGGGKPVRFEMNLVSHEADWRGGLRWMTARCPKFFEPPNPHADAMAGCGAYSGDEDPIDVAKFKEMAFRINWKLSDDFPYMGMFIPPVTNAGERWERSCGEPAPADKPRWTSCRRLNDYASYMKTNGFYVLNYFNVTEFGKNMGAAPVKKPGDPELWQDPRAFLKYELPDAALIPRKPVYYGAYLVDPGDPAFQKSILKQAERHIRWIPDSAGICIDRLDHLALYNRQADDGVSWIDGKPARSLCVSWNSLLSKLGPKMHSADKVIFVNPLYARLDLLRQVDGIYAEFGWDGRALNASALMGLDKPVLAWTYNETLRQTDPDSFFQRHLLLGVYPTAPYPWNNHCIQSSPSVDKFYLDYGPLLDAMRGKKWVLAPHCVEADAANIKVNLFQVPGGYVMPVVFGGQAERVTVRVRNIPGLNKLAAEALHPGADGAQPISSTFKDGLLKLQVPLVRGCAMVLLKK